MADEVFVDIKNKSSGLISVAGFPVDPGRTLKLPLEWLKDWEPPHVLIRMGLIEINMKPSEPSERDVKTESTFGRRELDL